MAAAFLAWIMKPLNLESNIKNSNINNCNINNSKINNSNINNSNINNSNINNSNINNTRCPSLWRWSLLPGSRKKTATKSRDTLSTRRWKAEPALLAGCQLDAQHLSRLNPGARCGQVARHRTLVKIQLNKNNVPVFEMSHQSNHFADSPFAARVSGRESLRYRQHPGLPSSSTRTWAPASSASGTLSILWTSGPSWKSNLKVDTMRLDWYFPFCVRDEKVHFFHSKTN